ncbi:MAG: AAA family ATPase [Candidatus Bathyarchaeia archaeon]
MNSLENHKVSAKVMRGEGPCTKPNGIAISKTVAEKLNLKVGDPVQVHGSKTTAAVVESIENIKEAVVYLGRTTRPNAGAHWDEYVQLSPLTVREDAKKVVVGPPEAGLSMEADAEALKGVLTGVYVTAGDLIEVGRRTFRPVFRGENHARTSRILVVETKPLGIVRIVPETEFVVLREFKEAGATRSSVTYDDIGGQREVIEKIREMVELPLRNPALFRHLGVEPPKGVLLHGPPGTGKTLLAKAVANESGAYFISVGASHLPLNEAERRLREIFAEAEQHAPSVIFIDEIDTVAPKREESLCPDDRRVVGVLLELMDGMKGRGQVIVMAATNRPNALDPALRRPGRFDREIEIPLPNENGRLEILQIHTRYMPLDEDVDLKKLAEMTMGYSGADLQLLCKEAAMSCIGRYRGKFRPDGSVPEEVLSEMKVNMADFIEASKRITPSCGREFIVEVPKVRWDEVGGYKELKTKILKTILVPWQYRHEAKKFGIKIPKGVLLFGPPGTGKTYLAKAVANEAKVNVIEARASELGSKYLYETEKNIARLFETARKAAPVIVIIDEVESIARRRGGDQTSAGKAYDSAVNELLKQIDGVQELYDVLLCTTNRPDLLDDAFLRSGRVEVHLEVPLPDFEARREIFKIHLGKVNAPLDEDVNVERLAELSDGLSGADIKSLLDQAQREWFFDYVNSHGNPEPAAPKLGMKYFLKVFRSIGKFGGVA